MIDIRAVHEAYETIENRHVGWVKYADNLVDGLKKPGKCRALEEVLTDGRLAEKVIKWIRRHLSSSLIEASANENAPEGRTLLKRKSPNVSGSCN